ncbi:hypothetical protein [Gloeothece citriformis]|uniref:hypothetical protein n=1 Tax=Gloeothece citriformis TaxID=2546356 RepID=UPI0012FEABB1|nr:hypothetical protein [Gloeothece citriformis]
MERLVKYWGEVQQRVLRLQKLKDILGDAATLRSSYSNIEMIDSERVSRRN